MRVVIAGGLLAIVACSVVEREVGDRFEEHETNLWTSFEDCEEAWANRPPTTRGPRIGTWNIKFFPDAQEEPREDEEDGTDVEWLACAIASIDVDVLAVQELKNSAKGVEKQQQLIQALNQRTGGSWRLALSTCMPEEVQHPGFLFDQQRVTGSEFRELGVMNPTGECSNYASPAFAGYFSIHGGPDFHFVAVHLAAGEGQRAIDDRAAAIAAIDQVESDAYRLVPDADVIFAGDFNTSGCSECSPAVASEEEIAAVAGTLAAIQPPFTVLPATQSCSRQDDSGSQLLDHFAVPQSMQEIPLASSARVLGLCENQQCPRLENWYEDAHERLSDHCPVVIDMVARDQD